MTNALEQLFNVIMERRQEVPVEDSYTNYLFEQGIEKILKKVGEESSEVIIAAMKDDRNELVNETVDLLYHLLVMLAEKGVSLDDVMSEAGKRSETMGNLKKIRPEVENY